MLFDSLPVSFSLTHLTCPPSITIRPLADVKNIYPSVSVIEFELLHISLDIGRTVEYSPSLSVCNAHTPSLQSAINGYCPNCP